LKSIKHALTATTSSKSVSDVRQPLKNPTDEHWQMSAGSLQVSRNSIDSKAAGSGDSIDSGPSSRKSLSGSLKRPSIVELPASNRKSSILASPAVRNMPISTRQSCHSQPGSRRTSSAAGTPINYSSVFSVTEIVCRICEESVQSNEMAEHSGFCSIRKELSIKLNIVDSQLEKIVIWMISRSREITVSSGKSLRRIVDELASTAKKCMLLPIYAGKKTVLKCVKYLGVVEKIRTHLLLRYADENEISIQTNRLHEAASLS
jgi:hypothetical protein